jgi:nucleoside 2-deoxyribosyltransferase-like protein
MTTERKSDAYELENRTSVNFEALEHTQTSQSRGRRKARVKRENRAAADGARRRESLSLGVGFIQPKSGGDTLPARTSSRGPLMRIFLSGGTRGLWQDQVISELSGAEFFDPRTLRSLEMRDIAATELRWLESTDCLFFYFEAQNPSGLGSAFEVGYCYARGIPIVFVDEKKTSHTQWLAYHCNRVYYTFDEGITALRGLIAASTKDLHGARSSIIE